MLRLALALTCFARSSLGSRDSDFAVSAYLPEWRYEGANWEVICQHVTHLILFSLEPTADGDVTALDRLPRPELLREARAAATQHGTKLMLCFGGNGRSSGFSPMVRRASTRRRFVQRLLALLDEHDLDGVDYNWEYPGYVLGRGYLSEAEIEKDYAGLFSLLKETHAAFASSARSPRRAITLAYYPDGRQEALLAEGGAAQWAELMHSMSYDKQGAQHSPWQLAKTAVSNARLAHLPPASCSLGLPFYARHSTTGDWTTYEDVAQRHAPLAPTADTVPAPEGRGATLGFNGVDMIQRKTTLALESRLGGVMIWEVGQDCRLAPVTHGDTTHVRTCPNTNASLLLAITRAIAQRRPVSASQANALRQDEL